MSRTFITILVCASVSLLSLLSADSAESWLRWRLTNFCFQWLVIQTVAWAFALPLLYGNRHYLAFWMFAAFTLGACWLPCYALLDRYRLSGRVLGEITGWQFAAVLLVALTVALHLRLIHLKAEARIADCHLLQQFKLNQVLGWFVCAGMLILVLRELHAPMMILDELQFDKKYYCLSLAQAASLLLTACLILRPTLLWMPLVVCNALSIGSWLVIFGIPRERDVGLWNMGPYERVLVIQVLGNLVPWGYRWAGWRLVPRQLAERLLVDANPNGNASGL